MVVIRILKLKQNMKIVGNIEDNRRLRSPEAGDIDLELCHSEVRSVEGSDIPSPMA